MVARLRAIEKDPRLLAVVDHIAQSLAWQPMPRLRNIDEFNERVKDV